MRMRLSVAVVVAVAVLCCLPTALGRVQLFSRSTDGSFAELESLAPSGGKSKGSASTSSDTQLPTGGKLPTCFFIHGLGQRPNGYMLKKLPSLEVQWGDIHKAMKFYCEPVFLHYNSDTRGWDDKSLQADVCGAIPKDKPVIVITHSMGNLVVAAGIKNKVPGCTRFVTQQQLDKAPTWSITNAAFWISMQGPFLGSPAAEMCYLMCDLSYKDPSKWSAKSKRLMEKAKDLWQPHKLLLLSQCCVQQSGSPFQGHPWPSVSSLAYSREKKPVPSFDEVAEIARQYAVRAMCGVSPQATDSPQARPEPMAKMLPLAKSQMDSVVNVRAYEPDMKVVWDPKDVNKISGSDGFVAYTSCRAGRPKSAFGVTPESRYYAARLNHGDGLGWIEDSTPMDQRPRRWLQNGINEIIRKLKPQK